MWGDIGVRTGHWLGGARLIVVACMMAGCGSASEPRATTTVQLPASGVPQANFNMLVGDSLRVDAINALWAGAESPLPGNRVTFRTSLAGAATVNGQGMLTAVLPGDWWLVALHTGSAPESVLVHARDRAGSFHITVTYNANVSPGWRAQFDSAARIWESVVDGALPEVQMDGLHSVCGLAADEDPAPINTGPERGVRIYIHTTTHMQGTGAYPEAVGGPCIQRALPAPTTLFGIISLNSRAPFEAVLPERRRYGALHEMGHALGLVGVVQGTQPVWFDFETHRYSGPMSLEAWRRSTGTVPRYIPEAGGHWGSTPRGDVMDNLGTTNTISWLSLGGLFDLGYPATWKVVSW